MQAGAAPPTWVGTRQRQHDASIKQVKRAIKEAGIKYDVIFRDDLRCGLDYDLIVTIGGDGTMLATAHVAGDIPVAGVNSMPGYSVGFFCLAKASGFEKKLSDIIKGRIYQKGLPMIEARIDSKPIAELALNDILFAGTTPVDTVRYRINIGGRSEAQRGSGVWIAAGPGSTAAILSAGGRRLPIDSKRLQYVVREPYLMSGHRCRLVSGLLKEGTPIAIRAEMADATIYVDGPKVSYPVPMGSRFTAAIARRTLKIFI